ncbi:MAG: TrmH family RNA methyltransferase [Nitriliruptorales bacterium]
MSAGEGLDLPQVTSTANPRVKRAAALRRRRDRDTQDRYLVEGPRYVADLLDSGHLEEIYAVDAAARELQEGASRAGVELTVVTDEVLRRLADSATPQGVVAVARQRHHTLSDVTGRGFLVVLAEVSDPGNVGAIVRTSVAAGASGLVLTTGSADPWNPKAVRAAAGAVARLPVVVGPSPAEVVDACRSAGQRTVGLDADAGVTIGEPGLLSPPVAVIFGSEAHGLPPDLLATLDTTAAIPRYGPVESLNLAAAVAVTVYAAAAAARTEGAPVGMRAGDRRPPAPEAGGTR